MPEVLDQDAIDTALSALPGWTYDGEALVRRADVPEDVDLAARIDRVLTGSA